MLPKVSVVTVTYNCAGEVEATLKSVLDQDYPNLEYLVVDGGSTDGTVDIIRKYAEQISWFVSEPDRGIYDAMNKALRQASGGWCAFMNAGDCYASNDAISRLFRSVTPESPLRVIYGNTLYRYADGTSSLHPTASLEELPTVISRYQPYCHQAVFYQIADKSDCLYDLRYRYAADYDVACRYWHRYGIAAYRYVPVTVCLYKAYEGLSSHPENLYRLQRELLRIKLRRRRNIVEIARDILWLVRHRSLSKTPRR